MKESQSCPVCLKPKEKASDGFVTRFIETCQCGKGSLKEGEDLKPVRMCAQCGKRISEGRAGSLTQWIFKPDNCDCATPEPVDRYFEVSKATKPFPSVQLDKEEELDLAADEFPINRYKPTRILGQGLAGRVYLCRDRFLGTRVAIKVLQSFTATSLISFQREAKVLSTLNHPNIVRVLDFGVTEQSKPYMVMAYVEGLTLTKLIAEKGAIDEKTAMIIISKVCSALSYAHGKGVFHRDIKSDNIIATILDSSSASLEAYVADFGLAMADLPHEDSTIYQGSTVVGTPRYMSPDQAMGRSFDARSDLYSVGCIFFEMLCGHAPFAGQTAIETLKMHAEAELPPIIAPGDAAISNEVKAVVLKCLEKQPEDRYQSMEELADSLSQILELPRYAVTSARFVNNDNSGIGSTIFSATGTATGASRLLKPVVLIPLLAILVAALYFVIRFSMGKTVTPKPGSISQKWTAPAKAELPTIEELDNLVVEKRKKEPPGKQEIVHTDVIVPRKPGELSNATSNTEKFSDRDLKLFKNPQNTKLLNLALSQVKTLDGISRFTELEGLSLDYTQVDDDALRQLKGLKKLARVTLCGTSISLRGLKLLDEPPSLRTVILSSCPALNRTTVITAQKSSPLVSYMPYSQSKLGLTLEAMTRVAPSVDLSRAIRLAKESIGIIEQKHKNASDLPHLYYCLGSWEFQSAKYLSAEKHLLHGLNMARTLNIPGSELNCLLILNAVYTRTQREKEADSCMRQVLSCHQRYKAGNPTEVIELLEQIAMNHREKPYLKKSISEYLAEIQLATAASKSKSEALPIYRLARLHADLGHAYFLDSQLKKAKEEVDLALAMMQKDRPAGASSAAARAAVLETILMAYINQWRWSDALKAALAEEKISKQFKLPPETLQRLNTHFATIYLDMGNIVKAKAYIKQALKQLSNLPSQSQNSGWLWDTYNTAALVEHADQEDEEAIKHYEMAIRIAREAKDSYRLADSLVKLARLYEDRDSHLKAASFQEQAIVVYTGKKILKSNTTMLAYLTLAEYYRAENDFSKSLQCIQKAEQLAKLVEPRDLFNSCIIENEKAATFTSMEDKANAQKHINAAINMIPQDVGKNNHQAHQLVDIYMNAAKIEDHFGNIDAALKRLRLGLELAKQQNILPKIGEIHWALARLLHRQGQTAESIRLLEDNIAIYTQLTGPESKEVKATVTALDMVRNGKNF